VEKVIKCILMDVDNVIISEIVEMDADIGEPNCKLINPLLFINIDDMKPWKSDVTNQTEFMVRAEDILTIADPTGTVIDKYLELTS
tara:strand:- start:212 stop:469 length:258 start_codon:yes stop_codon:yes gene_type:complete